MRSERTALLFVLSRAFASPITFPLAALWKTTRDRLAVHALVAEDVLVRLEHEAVNPERRLRDEEVRVLALGGVAGRNHHDARDEAAARVR